MRSVTVFAAALVLATARLAAATPYLPTSDQQLLERLPGRASDPAARALNDLRRRQAADPNNLDLAVELARSYFDRTGAEGDPRYVGYAQSVLAPWWSLAEPPVPARLMRAVLNQFSHGFAVAVADLQAVVKQDPDNGEGWAWLAAIAMVEARYADARTACEHVNEASPELIGPACLAAVDGVTGRGAAAAASLNTALKDNPTASPAERLWALTRLAEIEERLGHFTEAEAAFGQALALNLTDGYLLAAYADFLLDRARPAEAIALLKGKERSDLLLLRLALAGKAAKAPEAARWAADLTARFDAARLRGDVLHQKEEGRYALGILGDAPRAVALAAQNFAVQREPADARALLEAAVAARQPAAAEPALAWMASSGIESVALRTLAAKLRPAA